MVGKWERKVNKLSRVSKVSKLSKGREKVRSEK